MPEAVGRGTAGRAVTVGITNASAAVTAPAGTFDPATDVGRSITGTGIPAGATLTAVASATAATLSANATATNASLAATLGPHVAQATARTAELALGFRGWSPETPTEATTYQMTGNPGGQGPGVNEPTRVTSPTVARERRYRKVN